MIPSGGILTPIRSDSFECGAGQGVTRLIWFIKRVGKGGDRQKLANYDWRIPLKNKGHRWIFDKMTNSSKKGLRVPATNLRTPLTGETDTVETGRQTGGTNWKRNGLLARRERIRRHGMAGRAG